MNSPIEKLSEWLLSIFEPGRKLKLERGELLTLLVQVRGQYRKFFLLSPSVQQQMNNLIDEYRDSLPIEAQKVLEDMGWGHFDDYYLLPPGDYKKAVETSDILRATNERLHLSNEDLRLSNERLLHEIEALQNKNPDEGQQGETASV